MEIKNKNLKLKEYSIIFQRFKTYFDNKEVEKSIKQWHNSIRARILKAKNKQEALLKAENIKKKYHWYRILKCIEYELWNKQINKKVGFGKIHIWK